MLLRTKYPSLVWWYTPVILACSTEAGMWVWSKKQKPIKTYCLWKINITKLFIRYKHFFPWASFFFPWVSLFLGSVYHFINTNFIEICQRILDPKAQQAQFSLGLLRALSWPWGTGGGRNECRLWRKMAHSDISDISESPTILGLTFLKRV